MAVKNSDIVIYVPSGIQPVHGFDLWGTLVIQPELGPRVIEAYRAVAEDNGVPEETIEERIGNYKGVLDGEEWATGSKKAKFVVDLEEPVWQAYVNSRVDVDFEGVLYDDCLSVMQDIAQAGEGLCIITTANAVWVQKVLKSVNPEIGEKLGNIYFGNKTTPVPFNYAMADLEQKGERLVSHTEDQLKGFSGLFNSNRAMYATDDEHLVHRRIASTMFQVATVYVERDDLATPEQVASKGITTFVRDLRDVPYTSMVHKTE